MSAAEEPLGYVVEIRHTPTRYARRMEYMARGHHTDVLQWGRAAWFDTVEAAQAAIAEYTAFWGYHYTHHLRLVVRAVRANGRRRLLAEEQP